MKGLIIKDIRLIKNMKNSILMILLISIGMGAYLKDASFIIVYLSIIGATFTSSTMSYDEFDNGYSFLFSLPVTRKGYVAEKYCFGMLLCGGGWLLGAIVAVTAGIMRNTLSITDGILMALMMVPIPLILLSVLLPFHFKFGGEKGRVAMAAAMGLMFVVVIAGAKILSALQIDLDAVSVPLQGVGASTAGAIIIGVLCILLSCRISMGILEKKEF